MPLLKKCLLKGENKKRSDILLYVNGIALDMETKPRLMDGRGNAMLVCASVYQACKVYEMFSKTDFKDKCAIVTSYKPSASDIKGDESGEGLTEKLFKYDMYRKMLADYHELLSISSHVNPNVK